MMTNQRSINRIGYAYCVGYNHDRKLTKFICLMIVRKKRKFKFIPKWSLYVQQVHDREKNELCTIPQATIKFMIGTSWKTQLVIEGRFYHRGLNFNPGLTLESYYLIGWLTLIKIWSVMAKPALREHFMHKLIVMDDMLTTAELTNEGSESWYIWKYDRKKKRSSSQSWGKRTLYSELLFSLRATYEFMIGTNPKLFEHDPPS